MSIYTKYVMGLRGVAMREEINEAADFLIGKIESTPLIGMITGTGLADLAQVMDIDHTISYEDIPHFPQSTVPGHAGLLFSGHANARRNHRRSRNCRGRSSRILRHEQGGHLDQERHDPGHG